jgi:hypothetical protein
LVLARACSLGAVTLEEIARLAPKEPVRPAPKALKDAVRAWAEPQFLTVRNPLPVAEVLKAALERAGLGKVVEDVRLLHPSGQREFVVLVTKVAAACGSDESVYLYQWRNDHWEMLVESLNEGEQLPFVRLFAQAAQIHMSVAGDQGERVFALGGHHQWVLLILAACTISRVVVGGWAGDSITGPEPLVVCRRRGTRTESERRLCTGEVRHRTPQCREALPGD